MQQRNHFPWALLTFVCLFSVAAFAQTSGASPQASMPQAQTAPQSQAGSSAATPQSRQASIDDELQLTSDQKQRIQAVVDDENKQMGAVRDDSSMSPDQKQQKAIQIRRDGATRIKAVLTPDQLQKLAAIQEKARQQQGTSPSSPQ